MKWRRWAKGSSTGLSELQEIQSKLSMESDVMNKCKKFLYTTLLQYTKGDARVKVMSGGTKGALESYRYIVHKGSTQ